MDGWLIGCSGRSDQKCPHGPIAIRSKQCPHHGSSGEPSTGLTSRPSARSTLRCVDGTSSEPSQSRRSRAQSHEPTSCLHVVRNLRHRAILRPRGRAVLRRAQVRLEAPHIDSGPPILKFNGKDFTGFYIYTKDHKYEDPKKVFTVVDGMIRISGEEYGGIATCGATSANYHLIDGVEVGRRDLGPPQGEDPRLGHIAPLRRARRRGGGTVDAVDRVPDH